MKLPYHKLLLVTFPILFLIAGSAIAQQQAPQHVKKAIDDIKTVLTGDTAEPIDKFITTSIVATDKVDPEALDKRLQKMRTEVGDYWQSVNIRPDPDGFLMIFSTENGPKHIKVVLHNNGIYDLYFVAPPDPIRLTRTNLDSTFQELASKGMAGVAYIKMNGDVLFERGFGMANKQLEIPNTTYKIFGIGSRPIDFTRAGIYLLEQQREIDQNDSISNYFNDVPEEKQAITIRHLMTGRSGLPNFFHTNDDWDPDLAWIDRETAIDRLMAQKLLFKPGSDRKHSHAAFGLLAALIEKVTNTSYFNFLDKNFFTPAGMQNTNEYGQRDGHKLSDFAVGSGPQKVGLPNIPPNWGPTSWLIKGSGGMYSTLGDLLTFYQYVRSDSLFKPKYQKIFNQPSITLDGSQRGFELFNAFKSAHTQAYIFLNNTGERAQMNELFNAAENFVMQPDK